MADTENPGNDLSHAGAQCDQLPALSLNGADACSGRPFGALLDGKLDRLPLGQRAETFHLNFGLVAEQIFASIVRCDEAKAFGFIEPLYFTLHNTHCDLRNCPMAPSFRAPLITEL